MARDLAGRGNREQIDRSPGEFQRVLAAAEPHNRAVQTVMPRRLGGNAELPANAVMNKLQHSGGRRRGRNRHRYLVEHRCHDQGHESPRHPMAGAVKENQIVNIADLLHPVEITTDKVLGLPHGAGLAKMLTELARIGQQPTLDGAGIGDRITKIAVRLGKLAFLFLDIADIQPDTAIPCEYALLIDNRYTAQTDMDRAAIATLQLIFESAEFAPRLKIGNVAGKSPLHVRIDSDLLPAPADHHIRSQTGDVVKAVRYEGQTQIGIHLEKPVTRNLGKLTKSFFGVGKL